jgi:hypothetical protein
MDTNVNSTQAARDFFRSQEESRQMARDESANFRHAMSALATVGALKMLFGRRGA